MTKQLKLAAIGCAVIALFTSLLTVQTSPPAWQDESQILAFGAGFLDSPHGRDYVLDDSNLSKPAFCFGGAALAFLSWSWIPGVFGHRYLMLLFALLSSWLIYMLTRRWTGKLLAILLACAWMFEPSLCQSYRGGRLDILAFFFILGSLFLWQTRLNMLSSKKRNALAMLAGMSLMLAQLTWISTMLCLPFLCVALYVELNRGNQSYASLGKEIFLFGLGGCLLASVVFAVASEHMMEALNVMSDAPTNQTSLKRFDKSIMSLASAGRWSFVTLLIAFVSIGITEQDRERIVLAIGTLLTLALVIFTRAYVHRFIYALPMLFLCICLGLNNGNIQTKAKLFFIGIPVCFGLAISGFTRSINALIYSNDRDYTQVTALIDELNIQPSDKVYDATWQLYLASKNRFHPVRYWGHQYGVTLDADTNAMLGCDWVFLPMDRPDSVAQALTQHGFRESIQTTSALAYGPYSVWQHTEEERRNRRE